MPIYHSRREAGARLAQELPQYYKKQDVIVIGLTPGGVDVACGLAQALKSHLGAIIIEEENPDSVEVFALPFADKKVILVDDGVFDAAKMEIAIKHARLLNAAQIIVATPMGTYAAIGSLRQYADEVVCPYKLRLRRLADRYYRAISTSDWRKVDIHGVRFRTRLMPQAT